MQLLLPRLSPGTGLCYQPPPKNIGSVDETQTHTVVQFQLAFLAQLLGATFILPGEVCPYQYSQRHTFPPALNFSHSVYLGTAQHPQLHTGRSGLWPLHLRSYIATLLLGFSLRNITNSPSPLLVSVCLPVGTREVLPILSAQQLAYGFFTDRSRTNWGSGHQHQPHSYTWIHILLPVLPSLVKVGHTPLVLQLGGKTKVIITRRFAKQGRELHAGNHSSWEAGAGDHDLQALATR